MASIVQTSDSINRRWGTGMQVDDKTAVCHSDNVMSENISMTFILRSIRNDHINRENGEIHVKKKCIDHEIYDLMPPNLQKE
nr:unnamed protein product [Callosobruchus chinensis]